MITYTITLDDEALKKKFDEWKAKSPKLMNLILRRFGQRIVGDIQATKLSGQVLHARSGRLKNAMDFRMASDTEMELGDTKNSVVYAAIHEFGGVIVPVRASALHFKIGDRWVRTDHVNIPARPYARPTIEDFFRNGANELAELTTNEYIKNEGWN